MTKIQSIAILPGDGIGQIVTEAILPIFKALELPIEYTLGEIGWSCWLESASTVPDRTWKLIKESDSTLLGATTSYPEREAMAALTDELIKCSPSYVSPLVQLRQKLDLFASVRPCFSLDKRHCFNLCIIRENIEGLYSGLDFDCLPDDFRQIVSKHPNWSSKMNERFNCTLRLQTESGLKRIFEFAFKYAVKNQHLRVTFADKPNVLRKSSMMSRAIFESIAKQYSDIQADIMNVDAIGMHLVKKPEQFGVIVAENMFGDILSDVAAGVMGGLGVAPSANIGENYQYFEPVHGSGIRMDDARVNPSAMFLSTSLMLSSLGMDKAAKAIKEAVIEVIEHQKWVTPDLGGIANTQEMADAIIDKARNLYVSELRHV